MLIKKRFGILLVAIFWFLGLIGSSVNAKADTLPVLTWEAGKQQTISLINSDLKNPWKLFLTGNNQRIQFKESKAGKDGLLFYSIDLPLNQKLGSYLIEASNSTGSQKVIAGVGVVELQKFDLMQIPKKLLFICLSFVLLIAGISTFRASHYARIEYLRPKRVELNNSLLRRFYLTRDFLIGDMQPSLFKFQMVKEGELLNNISPWIWAVAPFVMLVLGGLTALQTQVTAGLSFTPIVIYTILAIAGVFDPFSGISAGFGFLIITAMKGSITNLNGLLSAVTFVLGWFAPGLISALMQEAIRKDQNLKSPSILRKNLPELLSSICGALGFYSIQLLTNSFANKLGPIINLGWIPSLLIGISLFSRSKLDQFLVKDLHLKGENYQIRSINLPRVIAPKTVLFSSLYYFGAIFVWTSDLKFSVVTTFIFALSTSLLLVRFESFVFPRLTNFRRHLLIETSVVVGITILFFTYISLLPMPLIKKAEDLVLVTGLVLLVHALYSAIHDASSRNSSADLFTKSSETNNLRIDGKI